jgi:chromosome partitioning protein
MRPIAMINQKGGVGKTTTAVNVAAALARHGRGVLLVDLDPQAHSSMHVGLELAADDVGVYDILVSGTPAGEGLRPVADNLAVIPSHIDLVASEVELAERPDREWVLRRALEPLRERFDVLIIDCPPSLGILTVNALVAAEELIIPLQPHFLALQGLGRLLETVALVRSGLNPELRVAGIVLCMYEKGTRLAQEVERDVRQFIADAAPDDPWRGARVFDAVIRRNVKLAECPSFGKTIFEYAPQSHGAEDYGALAHELLEVAAITRQAADRGEPREAALSAEPAPAGGSTPPQADEPGGKAETAVVRQAAVDADQVGAPPAGAIVEGPAATTDGRRPPPAPTESSSPATRKTAVSH